jgi:hypothetical protein
MATSILTDDHDEGEDPFVQLPPIPAWWTAYEALVFLEVFILLNVHRFRPGEHEAAGWAITRRWRS